MARRFKLTPTSICLIVKAARRERKRGGVGRPRSDRGRQANGARPASRGSGSRVRAQKPALTRQQTQARNRLIRRLVLEEGVALAVVGRRYGLSSATVRRIANSLSCSGG